MVGEMTLYNIVLNQYNTIAKTSYVYYSLNIAVQIFQYTFQYSTCVIGTITPVNAVLTETLAVN